jgi:hypothetical protein
MTKASGAASRAAAQRTADELLARRAAQLREREQELRRLVTDYHHATAQAAKIHENANTHAAKITADAQARTAAVHERADKEASTFEDEARTALRAILDLGETRESVADLTGLSTAQVRAVKHAAPTVSARQRAVPDTVRPTGAAASTAQKAR